VPGFWPAVAANRVGYSRDVGAHSSAGERSLHTREVPGSIPGAPMTSDPGSFDEHVDSRTAIRSVPDALRAGVRKSGSAKGGVR
jgi:hypothetical protein